MSRGSDSSANFLLGMGLGFQFRSWSCLWSRSGFTYQQLARYRRHVIVLSLILGAVLHHSRRQRQVAGALQPGEGDVAAPVEIQDARPAGIEGAVLQGKRVAEDELRFT